MRVHAVQQRLAAELRWLPQMDELRQWLEEYRVSLFAQQLGTDGPVSDLRIRTLLTV